MLVVKIEILLYLNKVWADQVIDFFSGKKNTC